MKRDLELIRNIMLYLEENLEYEKRIADYEVCQNLQSEDNSIEKICYHLNLIKDIRWINTVFSPIFERWDTMKRDFNYGEFAIVDNSIERNVSALRRQSNGT